MATTRTTRVSQVINLSEKQDQIRKRWKMNVTVWDEDSWGGSQGRLCFRWGSRSPQGEVREFARAETRSARRSLAPCRYLSRRQNQVFGVLWKFWAWAFEATQRWLSLYQRNRLPVKTLKNLRPTYNLVTYVFSNIDLLFSSRVANSFCCKYEANNS